MTSTQFDALVKLLRLRAGAQQAAARLVLVDGLAPADAARLAGVSPSALGNTLRVCRRGLTLARLACGICDCGFHFLGLPNRPVVGRRSD